MRREGVAVVLSLVFPAVIVAQVPDLQKEKMIAKLIKVYGTYLPGADPMPCGSGELTPKEAERVRALFAQVAGWPNFRAIYPRGKWEKNVQKCRLPMECKECLHKLAASGVAFQPLEGKPGPLCPVQLGGEIGGLKMESKDPLIFECDMALTLYQMAGILAKIEVEAMGILSSYRPESSYSFHSLGLAVDINWFKSSRWDKPVWVKTAFEKNAKFRTCDYKPVTQRGRFLSDIACTLWEEKLLNTIITPNYNEAHSNHFHLDLRPGDNRFYLN